MSQDLKLVKNWPGEMLDGGRGNSTSELPEAGWCLAIGEGKLVWLELRENGDEDEEVGRGKERRSGDPRRRTGAIHGLTPTVLLGCLSENGLCGQGVLPRLFPTPIHTLLLPTARPSVTIL